MDIYCYWSLDRFTFLRIYFLAVTIGLASSMNYYFIFFVIKLFNLALKPRELDQDSTVIAILAVSMANPESTYISSR